MFELPRVNHWSPPTESNNAWVGLTLVSLAPTQCSLKHVSGSKCHTNARVGLAHQISNLAGRPTVVNNDFQELRIAACIPRSSMLSVAALEGLFLMLAACRSSVLSFHPEMALPVLPSADSENGEWHHNFFLVQPIWRCVTVSKGKSDITILAAEIVLKIYLKLCFI